MSLTYFVKRIVTPWLGGVGDACGVPLSLVELARGYGDQSPEAIVRTIKKGCEVLGYAAPQWVMISGDETQMDNDLCVFLRTMAGVNVIAEVSGRRRLNRPNDRTPMYDHVIVRSDLPLDFDKLRAQVFHSFVARSGVTRKSLAAIDETLRRADFSGRKYVEDGEGVAEIVAWYGQGWRVTKAVRPER